MSATKESEEFLGQLFAAGHSVWFEWEAASTGWVTVGGCEADFVDVVGVYTGSAVNALTSVATGNASEGPDCPYGQREYTFRATSGTNYEIVVDGNPFSMPEAPPPATEGTFKLRIEATPPPSNDDFANAAPLVTHFEEEFEGQAFYFGSALGYNWNASEESGEPELIGEPSGASVWYSWTAPASGEARVSSCCGSSLRMDLYRGDSLGALQLNFGGLGPGGSATFTATAGATYRIVVYGLEDESTHEAAMSSFQINISMRVQVATTAPLGSSPFTPPADTTAPETTIAKRVLKRRPPIWVFDLNSSEAGSTFRCKLDKHPLAVCPSTKRFGNLAPGRHTFKAFSVDAAGNEDPSPTIVRFRVPDRPKKLSSRPGR